MSASPAPGPPACPGGTVLAGGVGMGSRRPPSGVERLLEWLPFVLWLAAGAAILALVASSFSAG